MLALWIILGIILWAIGWIFAYMIQVRMMDNPYYLRDTDRSSMAIISCFSWLAIALLFIVAIILFSILGIGKLFHKFMNPYLKKLEPKDMKRNADVFMYNKN